MDWRSVVIAGFSATFALYLDRVGFPLAYGEISRRQGLDDAAKGIVLSAFYYGYAATQIAGGILAGKIGGRLTLAIGMLCSGFLTLCLVAVTHSPILVGITRALIGAAQGLVIPSIHSLLGRTVPVSTKSRATSLTVSGMYGGSIVALVVLPRILARWDAKLLIGVLGACHLAWLAMLLLLRENGSTATKGVVVDPVGGKQGETCPTQFLWCVPLWAIAASSFAFHYSLYMIMNWSPAFFGDLLQTPLASMGNAKTIPYLLLFLSSNAAGYVGDFMIRRAFPVGFTRKVINTAGFMLTVVALVFMGLVHDAISGIIAISCTLMGLGFARGGFSVNHMDIAPNHAGFLIGIINIFGTLAGVVGVPFTGFLLKASGGAANRAGWIHSCELALLINAVCIAFFVFAGQGEVLFGDDHAHGAIDRIETSKVAATEVGRRAGESEGDDHENWDELDAICPRKENYDSK